MDKIWDSVYKACRAYEEVLAKPVLDHIRTEFLEEGDGKHPA